MDKIMTFGMWLVILAILGAGMWVYAFVAFVRWFT